MLHVHHHPVIQKVIIGMFVFGLMMFSMRVAFGAMTFPLPVAIKFPRMIAEVRFPTDLPSFTPADCRVGCEAATDMCNRLAGSDAGASEMCATNAAQCIDQCVALVQELPKLIEAQPEKEIAAPTAPVREHNEAPNQEEMMRREGEQKNINAQALEQMKIGGASVSRLLDETSVRLDAAKIKGSNVSPDLLTAIGEARVLLYELNGAKDTQSAQDILQKLQEQSHSFTDQLTVLDLAANFTMVMRQVDREYTRLKKSVDAQHSKFIKLDPTMQSVIGDPAEGVAVIRTKLDGVRSLASADAINILFGDIFERFRNAWQQYGVIEALRNPKTTLTKIQAQLKLNDRLIAKLTKSGSEHVDQLSKLQAELKTAATNMKTVIAGKDSKAIYDGFTRIADMQQEFEAVLGRSQDDGDVTNDKLNSANHWGVPTFGPPSGLPGSGVTDEKSLNMMRILAPYLPKSAN